LNNTRERNSSGVDRSNNVQRVASPPQGWTIFFDDFIKISQSKQSQ